jgi:hypothetical protein
LFTVVNALCAFGPVRRGIFRDVVHFVKPIGESVPDRVTTVSPVFFNSIRRNIMSSDNQYFDLTTSGVGFINRFRLNKPNNGNPYYSVTIAALRGKLNDGKSQKTYIDCNIVGDAIAMAEQLAPHFAGGAEPSIMVRFVAGDLEQRKFEYKSGERKGQSGYALKARLFDIKWFKLDGETVYSEAEQLRKSEMDDASEESTESTAPGSPQSPTDGTVSAHASSVSAMPAEVRLDKNDPYFEERRQQLREQGYRWDRESNLWRHPQAA